MKMVVDRKAFHDALATTARIRAPKVKATHSGIMEVDMRVVGRTIELQGFDGKISIRCIVPDVTHSGEVHMRLPTDKLLSILKEIDCQELAFDISDSAMTLKTSSSKFKLGIEDLTYPDIVTGSFDGSHSVKPQDMVRMIHRTRFSTDENHTVYALAGIKIETDGDRITMISTDSRRLSVASSPVTASGPVEKEHAEVIPTKLFNVLASVISASGPDVEISKCSGNVLSFRQGNLVLSSSLVEGRFPRWQTVIPKADVTFIATKEQIENAVRLSQIMTTEEHRKVEYEFSNGLVKMSSRVPSAGESEVSARCEATGMIGTVQMNLDSKYVDHFVKAMDRNQVVNIGIKGENDAIKLEVDDQWVYVLMPMSGD